MRILRSLWLIINYKSLIVVSLACLSTYLCGVYSVRADFPMTIVGIAVVFPIVFSIGGAYNRRETALKHYSSLKAHGRALFFACRDWVPNTDAEYQAKIKELLRDIMKAVRDFLHSETHEHQEKENIVYGKFSELSLFIKSFRDRELPSGEASRSNQYLSKMIDAFESLKHIYQYRTPVTLRAYSKFFILLVPILYGPYFEHIASGLHIGLRMLMPALLSLVLVSLDNIQDHLENPYDQVGEDDVQINAEKFFDWLDS
jgi:predicted membrane chloride channel (bestrophin family)